MIRKIFEGVATAVAITAVLATWRDPSAASQVVGAALDDAAAWSQANSAMAWRVAAAAFALNVLWWIATALKRRFDGDELWVGELRLPSITSVLATLLAIVLAAVTAVDLLARRSAWAVPAVLVAGFLIVRAGRATRYRWQLLSRSWL